MKVSTNDMTRRGVLMGGASILGLAVLGTAFATTARPALAMTTPQAKALVDQVVASINQVINSGRSESQMIADFERIFRTYGDVPTIARSALGPPARSASQAQLSAFTEAFSGYIARKYGRRFREFIGGQVVVEGAREAGRYHEVQAVANLRGMAPFRVSFMVSDRNRFFDMVIEGISLLKSERVEIGSMLDRRRGNIDALVQDLRRAG